MAVYVDDARIRWRGRQWSHLVADTPEELHRAARALGLRREWAQEKGRTLHYDVPEEYRLRAIECRLALPISWRELVRRRSTLATAATAAPTPGPRPTRARTACGAGRSRTPTPE